METSTSRRACVLAGAQPLSVAMSVGLVKALFSPLEPCFTLWGSGLESGRYPSCYAGSRAERGLSPPLPDTLSMSPDRPFFTLLFPLQNANFPACNALPLLFSSLRELVFSWAELQAWMRRHRGTVPWQDLGLYLQVPENLLRASRRAWALERVLATSPVLSYFIRSPHAPGLWQPYLAMMLLPISWVRNRGSHCPLPLDQPGHAAQ